MVVFCERQVSGGGASVWSGISARRAPGVPTDGKNETPSKYGATRRARLAPEAGHGAALIAVGMKLNAFR